MSGDGFTWAFSLRQRFGGNTSDSEDESSDETPVPQALEDSSNRPAVEEPVAVFKETPWSIAKFNAASRSKENPEDSQVLVASTSGGSMPSAGRPPASALTRSNTSAPLKPPNSIPIRKPPNTSVRRKGQVTLETALLRRQNQKDTSNSSKSTINSAPKISNIKSGLFVRHYAASRPAAPALSRVKPAEKAGIPSISWCPSPPIATLSNEMLPEADYIPSLSSAPSDENSNNLLEQNHPRKHVDCQKLTIESQIIP